MSPHRFHSADIRRVYRVHPPPERFRPVVRIAEGPVRAVPVHRAEFNRQFFRILGFTNIASAEQASVVAHRLAQRMPLSENDVLSAAD